jgi:hypothetical protein
MTMTKPLGSKSANTDENCITPLSNEERVQRKREVNRRSMAKTREFNAAQGLCRCGRELDKQCYRCQRMGRDKKAAKGSIIATKKTIQASLETLTQVRIQWERSSSIQAFERWVTQLENELRERMK